MSWDQTLLKAAQNSTRTAGVVPRQYTRPRPGPYSDNPLPLPCRGTSSDLAYARPEGAGVLEQQVPI